jgi:DNA segregation ATPase FtsK/SpoIIIE, S-DNA-T family
MCATNEPVRSTRPPRLGRRGRAGRGLPRPEPGAGSAGRGAAQRRRLVILVQFARLLGRLVRLIARHPLAASVLALVTMIWVKLGWVTLAALVLAAVVMLAAWRWFWPVSFSRWAGRPARGTWRAWCYRRRWAAVLVIAGLAPWYQGRTLLPVLGKVTASGYVDRVQVRLVSGQSAADFARCADNLAHGFRALLCRVRTARSGAVVLEFIRRDALAALVPALPIPEHPDLKALPVGRREDGLSWLVRLHGTHVLIAGATGAGKASLLWGLVRAMFSLMQAGLVRVLAADPKLMELAYGRVIFESYGAYAADPAAIAAMLDRAIADMQDRAGRFAGRQRDHTPTVEDPFTVVLVDEVAFLTAYQPDRKLKERIMNAPATLTTQGRAVGYCVVAALQDPRKDVLAIRNLFPDRIAMRLDEPEQVNMVLGDGARDRGAACELIPADPATGAGVAFVRLELDPDPVRVRAGWVTDADIRALADACIPDRVEWPEVAA